ncbi:hypothetical protein TNCV_1412461 [Trichonephila clavipes]|nr:hypothetical protein TNCV_1412461 [Trichonephila clavipes]
MSSRHHIDDFYAYGRMLERSKKGKSNRCCQKVRHRSHSVVSRLWKSFFKTTGMCNRRHGEVALEVRRLQKTDISSYQQKGTGAPQLSRWQNQFLAASGKADLPKNCCQTFEGREDYTHADLLCVSHCRDSTVLPVCNGVVSITIGLTGLGMRTILR